MNEADFYRMVNEKEGVVAMAFPALMRKVYVWMSLALVITGLTAYGVASIPVLTHAVLTADNHMLWILLIAEFILVMAISGAINKISLGTATIMFITYSVLNGMTLSVIFLSFTMSSIASTFFITAGTFGVMSLIGYTTKTDLTSLGKIFIMGLIGLVIATVVNMFMNSSFFDMIISYLGVAIFVGLTAYDTQKIKMLLYEADDATSQMQKLALLGSLTLYLDFVNLFLMLLRLFGDRK